MTDHDELPVLDGLLAEAIRGFLLEKHLPFDQLDPWADELVAIVHEHMLAAAATPEEDT